MLANTKIHVQSKYDCWQDKSFFAWGDGRNMEVIFEMGATEKIQYCFDLAGSNL